MSQVGRRALAALAVVVAAACGTASASSVTLASYATGSWACVINFSSGGHPATLKPRATVTATSATTGTVTITIPSPPPFPTDTLKGQWTLSGGELMVSWAKRSQGTAQAKPISLHTKQFRIRSGTPGNAKWSTVTVDHAARSVTFDFPLSPGGPPNQPMTCAKA